MIASDILGIVEGCEAVANWLNWFNGLNVAVAGILTPGAAKRRPEVTSPLCAAILNMLGKWGWRTKWKSKWKSNYRGSEEFVSVNTQASKDSREEVQIHMPYIFHLHNVINNTFFMIRPVVIADKTSASCTGICTANNAVSGDPITSKLKNPRLQLSHLDIYY